MSNFEKWVDDDPRTDHEPWPTKASLRASAMPRCLNGHFVAKKNVKTIWPRSAYTATYIEVYCPKCDRTDDIR